jgi:hypothetical protein
MSTRQGLTFRELGAGFPQGGRRWSEVRIELEGNSQWTSLYTAVGGDIAVTQCVVRGNLVQPVTWTVGQVVCDHRKTTIIGPAYFTPAILSAKGTQDDGRMDPLETGEAEGWGCKIVPEGETIDLFLDGTDVDDVDFTIVTGWEPATVGAHLVEVLVP